MRFKANGRVTLETQTQWQPKRRLIQGFQLPIHKPNGLLVPGVAVETDTALAPVVSAPLAPGRADETDTAFAPPLRGSAIFAVTADSVYMRRQTSLPAHSNAFSVLIRAKVTTYGSYLGIFALESGSGAIYIETDDTGALYVYRNSGSGSGTTSIATGSDANWRTIAVVGNGSNLLIYSAAEGASTLSLLATVAWTDWTPDSIAIGAEPRDFAGQSNGTFRICGAMIWDAALSQAQLESNLASFTPVYTTNIWWANDGRSPATEFATDQSGAGHNFTLTGTPTFTTDVPDLSSSIDLATGLATETDTALACALVKNVATGLAAETDTSLTRALVKNVTTGLSTETDTASAPVLVRAVAGVGTHDVTIAASHTATSITTDPLSTADTGDTVLVIDVQWYGAVTITSVAGTIGGSADGNTYTQQGSPVTYSGDTGLRSARYICERPNGGDNHVFTVTFSTSLSFGGAVFITEVVGCIAAGTITDQAPSGAEDTHNASTAYVSPTTGTTAQALELVVASTNIYSVSGTYTFTQGNGFTTVDEVTDASVWTGCTMVKALSSTGTAQSSLTVSGGGGADTGLSFITTFKLASSEISLDTGRADETDTAFASSLVKNVGTGLASETDTALSLALVKQLASGLATETDAALALALVKQFSPGLATETDAAFSLALVKNVGTGLATETDSAFSLALQKILTTGQATEVDTAYATYFPPLAAGTADETDTALANALVKNVSTGLSAETDAALTLSLSKSLSTGLAAESDTALSLALVKQAVVGLAAETDTALPRTLVKQATVGLASEADSSLNLSLQKQLTVGLGSEAASALSIALQRQLSVGTSSETDSSFSLSLQKQLSTGLSAESDTAQKPTLVRSLTPQVSVETSVAFSLALVKYLTAGLSEDTEFAFSVFDPTQNLATGRGQETDAALPLGLQKLLTVTQANSTETAFSLSLQKLLTTGLVQESDAALQLSLARFYTPGVALEQSTAFGFTLVKQMHIGMAVELNVAMSTFYTPPVAALLGPPTVIVGARGLRLVTHLRKGPRLKGR